jgi:hypothetical protein
MQIWTLSSLSRVHTRAISDLLRIIRQCPERHGTLRVLRKTNEMAPAFSGVTGKVGIIWLKVRGVSRVKNKEAHWCLVLAQQQSAWGCPWHNHGACS